MIPMKRPRAPKRAAGRRSGAGQLPPVLPSFYFSFLFQFLLFFAIIAVRFAPAAGWRPRRSGEGPRYDENGRTIYPPSIKYISLLKSTSQLQAPLRDQSPY